MVFDDWGSINDTLYIMGERYVVHNAVDIVRYMLHKD